MTGLNELDELLGAYALDAVDDDERRMVDEYLSVNPRAAAEVAEHREVASLLAFSGADAPGDLWSRIETTLEETPPEPSGELASVMHLDERRRRRTVRPWVSGVSAAAAVLLVVAVGWFVVSGNDTQDDLEAAFESALDADTSQVTELVSDGDDATADGVIDAAGHGYIDARDLPTLPSGETYQLWGVMADSGDVISLGVLGAEPGLSTFSASASVAALALTIEESPGVISDGNPDGAYVGELG